MKTLKNLIYLFVGIGLLLTTSCHVDKDNDESDTSTDYAVAETQLKKDYTNVTNVVWSTNKQGYQIATFSGTKTRTQTQDMTAWYSVSGTTANLEMDSEDLGTTVPNAIKAAFEATKYGGTDKALWRIKEIELEHNYDDDDDDKVVTSYYEMELENIANTNLEAKLLFDFTTGALIFSKEELDDDDGDDDKYVITDDLKAAVEAAAPGAQIIEAEVDDNLIEVDAIITVNGVKKEIELKFTMGYVLDSKETESEFKYSELPAKFSAISDWFAANSRTTPTPNANTEVEITEGVQTEDDYNIGEYYYEVEIDEYEDNQEEYEVEFYLNKEVSGSENPTIIAVIVNEEKISNIVTPDRNDVSHIDGFKLDFPEATNVQWKKDDLGYNYVLFDLKVADERSRTAETYNAEAWYDEIYINFLTQEYIPVSEVPSEVIEAVEEVEDYDPTLECKEAIKATCKESVYYKLLFENDIRTYIYTICNNKVATYDEGEIGHILMETAIPELYAMRYIELNYDNYCLTDDSYTESDFEGDETDKNGYTVPVFFYETNYLAEIVFVNNNIDFVRELHYLTDFDNESTTLPDNVPENIQNAVYEYIATNYNDVKDGIRYGDMTMWCNSEGEAEYYYLNFQWDIDIPTSSSGWREIKIMNDGSITDTQG